MLDLKQKALSLSQVSREELKIIHQKGVLVALVEQRDKNLVEDPLAELQGLAETAGVEIVGRLTQMRRSPCPAMCLGKGKIEELKILIEATDAEVVIFDNALSPSQGRNLEKELNRIIVDRSEVILDIFASRARTYEAKLQVELAQLLYLRPRLKRMWTHLERIEGGIGAGRGPGEKQIETDRRLIDKRIDELRRKLAEVVAHRQRMVSQRSDHKTVSLVGYTNAGKSTLMNALTGADVYVADQLFATLDTRTRNWALPGWGEVLLSDTVGFIRKLPHHLVASFKSTLEEARNADLLLHVVDSSHPEAQLQIDTVHQVLDEIGVDRTNMILVLNKADAVTDRSIVDVLRVRHESAVAISARTREGFDRLANMVAKQLGEGFMSLRITGNVANGRIGPFLAEHAQVSRQEYTDTQVIFECLLPRSLTYRLRDFDVSFEPIVASQPTE